MITNETLEQENATLREVVLRETESIKVALNKKDELEKENAELKRRVNIESDKSDLENTAKENNLIH